MLLLIKNLKKSDLFIRLYKCSTRRQARMRKPRPPHQARRMHGPRAALAGYKNLASSISCSSSPSSFSHNPEFSTSATVGARASNPTSSNQAPLIGHAAAEKTTPARCGLSTTRIRDQPLQFRCC